MKFRLIFLACLTAFLLIINVFVIQDNIVNQTQIRLLAKKIYENCIQHLGDKENCYKKEVSRLTAKRGIKFAEQTLYALQDLDPKLRNCHVLAHEISRTATRKDPEKWKDLLNTVNINSCGAGFLHGVLEARVGYDSNFKITTDFIEETCIQGELDFKARACSHILGHLTAFELNADINKSLKICDSLADQLRFECGNGVFMEESYKTNFIEHGLAEKPPRTKERTENQRKRCLKYSGISGDSCWTDMAELIIESHAYDPEIAYTKCNEAPARSQRFYCYKKAVTLLAISPGYDRVERIVKPCELVKSGTGPIKYDECLYYMASSLIHFSVKFMDRGIALCSNVEESHQNTCFRYIGELLVTTGHESAVRKELCQDVPEKFKNLCTAT